MYQKDIIGHVSIDLVSFPDNSNHSHPLFWAVDLKCEMTDVAAVMPFFDFLIEGEMENVTGHYFVQSAGRSSMVSSKGRLEDIPKLIREERQFVYIPHINYSGVGKMLYKSFFSLCKMRGISFDLEDRKGITFILPDSLQSSIIGLIAMGRSSEESIELMCHTITFISDSFPDKLLNLEQTYSDEQNFGEVLSMIKILHKRQERKKKRINIHSNL